MHSRLFLAILAITGTGCSFTNLNKSMAKNELVMCQGMIIEATNQNGTIRIEAGRGLTRTYVWDDNRITLNLKKRTERWLGSLGAYSPTGTWKIHAVVEEGQQHFCSEKEALEWLSWQNDRFHYVYTSDGLVVGWYLSDKNPNDSLLALCVEVWQFYIKGHKPFVFDGAENNQIKCILNKDEISLLPKAGDFIPSEPNIIMGRLYSGKAIDYLTRDAGVKGAAVDVERVIKKGKQLHDSQYSYYVYPNNYYDYNVTLTWVMLDETGRVVLLGN